MTLEKQLAIVFATFVYLAGVAVFLWILRRRAERLFSDLRDQAPPGVWDELGAPASIREATSDPQGRWREFIRHRAYAPVCSPDLVARLDGFRRNTNIYLVLVALAGLIVLWLVSGIW